MADTFNIELPDGRILRDIPVGTTKAEIEAKIQPVMRRSAFEEGLSETAKVADKSIRGGVLALPGMMGDAAVWASQKAKELAVDAYNRVGQKTGAFTPNAQPPAPVEMWPSDALQTLTGGPIAKPTTEPGKAISAVGESTVGTLSGAGPASKLKQLAILGATAGLGGETAARLTNDNPLARMVGGLAAAGPLALHQLYKGPNTAKVAREAFEGLSADDVENMILTAGKSKAAGLELLPNQALGRQSNVDALVSALATSPEGKKVTNVLRTQPLQIQTEMEALKSTLPGAVRAPRDINNRGQEVATDLIEAAKTRRTNDWKQTLKDATDEAGGMVEVPAKTMQKVSDKLGRLAEMNGNPAIKANLLKLRKELETEDGYITDPEKLNDLLKYAASQTKSVNMQTTGLDAGASKYVNKIITNLRDDFGEAFEPIRKANANYAANTEVSGLKKSVIGELAGRSGALPDVNAPKGKLFAVFDAGRDPNATRSEILTMQEQLSKSDPTIFTDAAKTWLSDKLSTAFKGEGARESASVATKLTNILGAPQQASFASTGLKDTLKGMARAEGLQDDAYKAVPEFLRYVALAAERPSNTGGLTSQGINALAESSMLGSIGRASIITPFRQPILAYVHSLGRNTRAELDNLLTTPEGIRMLYTLSRTSPKSDAYRKAVETFLSTNAAAQGGEQLSPDVNN